MPICKNPACRKKFKPVRPFQKGCCMDCDYEIAMAAVMKKREQAAAKAKRDAVEKAKQKRRDLRERKAQLKSRNDWVKEAQAEFNKFIRLRDASEPCISCGEVNPPMLHGGQWDCGHYLSVGSHPELRFEELNAYKQCKSCNGGAGRYAGKNRTVSQKYRENLIQKIGLTKVEWLEGPHDAKHYTIDDLKGITAKYKAKCKQLQNERETMAC